MLCTRRCRDKTDAGVRVDYLPEFTRSVGGDITLHRCRHTAWVRLFTGSKAICTLGAALPETDNLASFLQIKVWIRILDCSAASLDGRNEVRRYWGCFMVCHGQPPLEYVVK